ncbi:MAG: arginine N-succinyltransferase [Betaproteobacteria bacterium]|nr:arginine N-succinyltransferase [Betaproteobacteria bacterium]
MMRIRPISLADLPSLMQLVKATGVGLTTLPSNEAALSRRIEASLASFAGTAQKADELFLFVLEDIAAKRVVGTCGLATAVGLRQAWYSYRVGLAVHASQELEVFTQTQTLSLTNDHTGHSELCSLFLAPDYRRDRNGLLLSKSRFLFIAQHRERFSKKIIAELRGVADDNGQSPFWESLGRRFFSMEFSQADYLTGIGRKSFVAELMPKHPLYTTFLSPEAQAAIGETHPHTLAARRMLESEGFRYEGYVDIFDAGPTVECDVADVNAVAASKLYRAEIRDQPPAADAPYYLVSTTGIADYRATLVQANPTADVFPLSSETAAVLGVSAGKDLRAVALSVSDR